MAKNEANREGPFKARSRGTLRFTGPIPDYGTVTNDSTIPVQSNRTKLGEGTARGNVKSVSNMKP